MTESPPPPPPWQPPYQSGSAPQPYPAAPPPTGGAPLPPGYAPAQPYAAVATQPTAPFWVVLFVGLAVLGGISLLLPWFRPTIDGQTAPGEPALHSWNGVVFYLAPIFMIFSAVRAVQARGNLAQFRRASVSAIVAGALMVISVVVGWARVPANYRDWDLAKAYAASHGLTLGRGPLFGYYLAVAVAVLFVVLGIAGVVYVRRALPPAPPFIPSPVPPGPPASFGK